MNDIATRNTFERWLRAKHEELIDRLGQHPRSLKSWATDYARELKSEVAEMGQDAGFAGVFSSGSGEEDGGRLHDPEALDDEPEW